eukprot:3091404-Pyramimonas_sp.AAC.1
MTKRCDDEPRGVDEGFCGEPTRYFGGLGHGDGGEPGSCKEEDASVGGVAAAAAAAAAAAVRSVARRPKETDNNISKRDYI